MNDDTIFEPLLDFFFVTKFQNHRSEHDHGFLWVVNAPAYGLDFNKIIETFVDKYIIVTMINCHQTSTRFKDIITKKNCKKKNQDIWCFNFPWPLVEETQILEPIPLGNPFWRRPI